MAASCLESVDGCIRGVAQVSERTAEDDALRRREPQLARAPLDHRDDVRRQGEPTPAGVCLRPGLDDQAFGFDPDDGGLISTAA